MNGRKEPEMAIEATGNGEFNARDARSIASRSENPYISRFAVELGVTVAEIEDLLTGKEAMRTARASAMLRKRVMPMQLEERFHAPIRRLSKKSLISCDPQDMRFAAFSERKGRLIWPIGLKPYIS